MRVRRTRVLTARGVPGNVKRAPVWFPPGQDPGAGWAPTTGPNGEAHDEPATDDEQS